MAMYHTHHTHTCGHIVHTESETHTDTHTFSYIHERKWSSFCAYLQDELEADDNLTLEQRLALAGGSTLEGVGDAVGNSR